MNELIEVLFNYSMEEGSMSKEYVKSREMEIAITKIVGKESYSSIEDIIAEYVSECKRAAYGCGFNDAKNMLLK